MLLGPSGCGKSTLLNCIAGLLDITDGQICINGKNVTWEEPKDRGIGMVFQSYALYPQMTVRGNLSFGLKNAGLPKAEIDQRIARAVGDPADRAAARAQARRPLRRPAPARRDRPGAGARRRRLPVRRAALQPRRQAPLRAARRDQAAAPAAREHHDLRHPRPDRGDDAGRPHRGHARRHHPAARRPQDHLQQARQPLRRRLHRLAGDDHVPGQARRQPRRQGLPRRRTPWSRSTATTAAPPAAPAATSSSASAPSMWRSAAPRPRASPPWSTSTSRWAPTASIWLTAAGQSLSVRDHRRPSVQARAAGQGGLRHPQGLALRPGKRTAPLT